MSINQNTIDLQSILDKVNALPEAGTDLPELTNPGSASDLRFGKELIDENGNIITGTIETKTDDDLEVSGATVTVPAGYYDSEVVKSVSTTYQASPNINIDNSGLITASVTQPAGYVSAGTKSVTKQLSIKAGTTITPTESSQLAVAPGCYTTGAVHIAAIPSSYITTTDATAAASEIFSGETAYVNGSKVTGTFTVDSELTEMESKISQLSTILDSKAAGGSSGGASIETCTVTIYSRDFGNGNGILGGYSALQYENNEFVIAYVKPSSTAIASVLTLNNVVCGSCIEITTTTAGINPSSVSGGDTEILWVYNNRSAVRVSTTPVDVTISMHWD